MIPIRNTVVVTPVPAILFLVVAVLLYGVRLAPLSALIVVHIIPVVITIIVVIIMTCER